MIKCNVEICPYAISDYCEKDMVVIVNGMCKQVMLANQGYSGAFEPVDDRYKQEKKEIEDGGYRLVGCGSESRNKKGIIADEPVNGGTADANLAAEKAD